MRRWFLVVLSCILLIGIGIAFVQPHLLKSASDRAIRLVERFSPDVAARLRYNASKPLAERLAERGFNLGDPVFIRIFKQESQLEVWLQRGTAFELFETYPICTWSGDLGPKLMEGDGQSPEGFYAVGLKQMNPNSSYFRAFNLGFPNAYDRTHGRNGSFLMVHGDCLSIGCYAMTDKGIADIYRIVDTALLKGQSQVPVHAFPFRMTGAAMTAKVDHRWAAYWNNLKEGYDLFERTRVPPKVSVCHRRYAFSSSLNSTAK